jgi:D-alanyl-D-alanine carboxypeptidase
VSDRLDIRRIVREARVEATAAGSARVEAEHLLLALSARPDTDAGRLLADQGLDHATLRRALDLEFEQSLAAVGVRLDDFALPAERTALVRESRWLGRSVQIVIQRAMKARAGRGRDARRLQSLHLLVGVLTPTRGTVPRALAAIQVDRAALLATIRSHLERAA